MKVLVIGDVFGKPGRHALKERLGSLRDKHGVDLVVANGENAAEGFGVTAGQVDELAAAGVDVVTSGDHVWDRRELIPVIGGQSRLLRPLNYPEGVPGRGSAVLRTSSGLKVAVVNVQGRVFMSKQILEDPFRAAKAEVERLKGETPVVVVDFHAEATSEKMAMGWHLDGVASAVIGTHTHVQTADERILPGGTAYLTDAGLTGPADSVIGIDRERVLARFLSQMRAQWTVAKGRVQVCAALLDLDEKTGRALEISRIFETFDLAGGK